MPAPFQIVAAPFDVYLAPTGTAFPVISAAPAGAWIKLGSGGAKDYAEDGVLVRPEQTNEEFFSLGATGPRKVFRTKEGLVIEFTLHDATAESYQAAWNQNAITTLAGPPAEKTIQIKQGLTVSLRAMLIRGVSSPYADSANNTQWDVPLVYQNGNPETVYTKGRPVGLKLSFRALEDDALGLGKIHLPTA